MIFHLLVHKAIYPLAALAAAAALLLGFFSLTSGQAAPDAIRNVAPGGVDSGNCNPGPCATLAYALSQRLAGRYGEYLLTQAVDLAKDDPGSLFARLLVQPLALLALACAITGAMAALTPARAFAGRLIHGEWSRSAYYEIPAMLDDLPPARHGESSGELGSVMI